VSRYNLVFHPAARKELSKMDRQTQVFIVKSLDQFIVSYDTAYEIEMMRSLKIKKLKGDWAGFYRLRLRNYRVIYEKMNDLLVIHIVRVGHRAKVY